jgi:signal peptidase I
MDLLIKHKILILKGKSKTPIRLKVKGCSMFPVISEGDELLIKGNDSYEIGDILVFTYNADELVVHRLLKRKEDLYLCKGDNSFRLEMFKAERIVGKVININGMKVPDISDEQIEMSFEVNKIFTKNNYDVNETTKNETYINYVNKYIYNNGG